MPGKKQEGEGHEPLRTPTSTTGFGFLDDQKGVASGDRLHTTATCQYFALEPAAASGTTLESMTVDVKEKLNEDAARHLFRQLLFGLQHAHDRRVAHCYLSLRNLLVVSETTNHPSNQPSAGKRSSPTPESDGGGSTKKMPAGSAPANKSTAAASKTNKNSETITTSKKSTSEPNAKKTVGVEVNKFNDQRKHCQWTLKISGFGAKDFEDPQERKIPLPSFVAPEAQSYGAHVLQEVPQVKEPEKHKKKTKHQPKREDDEVGLEINNNNSREEGEEEEGAPVSATASTGSGRRRFDHLQADCWSCGAILFAMVTGRLPFADSQGSSSRMHSKIDKAEYTFPTVATPTNGGRSSTTTQKSPMLSPQVRDLINNLLVIDPTKRLSVDGMLEHPWVQMTAEAQALLKTDCLPGHLMPADLVSHCCRFLRPTDLVLPTTRKSRGE